MDVGLAFTSLEKQEDGPPSTIKKKKIKPSSALLSLFSFPSGRKAKL
jgi:hypothetical protein